jgi:hypothetical protein
MAVVIMRLVEILVVETVEEIVEGMAVVAGMVGIEVSHLSALCSHIVNFIVSLTSRTTISNLKTVYNPVEILPQTSFLSYSSCRRVHRGALERVRTVQMLLANWSFDWNIELCNVSDGLKGMAYNGWMA